MAYQDFHCISSYAHSVYRSRRPSRMCCMTPKKKTFWSFATDIFRFPPFCFCFLLFSVFVCCCLFLSVSVCFCLFLSVVVLSVLFFFFRFCPFMLVSVFFWPVVYDLFFFYFCKFFYCFCPFVSISVLVPFFTFLFVSVNFCWFLSVTVISVCFYLFFVSFCPFLYVSVRFCQFLSVSSHFWTFMSVSIVFFFFTHYLENHQKCEFSKGLEVHLDLLKPFSGFPETWTFAPTRQWLLKCHAISNGGCYFLCQGQTININIHIYVYIS